MRKSKVFKKVEDESANEIIFKISIDNYEEVKMMILGIVGHTGMLFCD